MLHFHNMFSNQQKTGNVLFFHQGYKSGDAHVTHQVLNTFYESLLLHDPPRVSGKTGIFCINILVHYNMCKNCCFKHYYRSQLQILSSCARLYNAQQADHLNPIRRLEINYEFSSCIIFLLLQMFREQIEKTDLI